MNSYWIWNYGDYEIFHSNLVNSRREQYGMDYPPFWRLYDVDRNVVFFTEKEIEKTGTFTLFLNGKGYITVDGKMYGDGKEIYLKKGLHKFEIHIMNLYGLPAAFISSDVISTNGEWYTLNSRNEKITVGYSEKYTDKFQNPEVFPFSYKTVYPVASENINNGILYTFEKEMFGYVNLLGVNPNSKLHISYGESREEALDTEFSVVQEDLCGKKEYKLKQRAFRYIYITGTKPKELYCELEYQNLGYTSTFKCNNESVNKIYDMCAYTLQLNMREVLTEAVKRDRWLWGGDAYQAFKFIKYYCADSDTVRRSLIGLRGKEPFCEHINTITDYTLFWVIGLLEYYENYGDVNFIAALYEKAVSLMDFCKGREDENEFIVKKYADWIFIDWSPIEKTGAVCAEQMLYIAANRAMGKLSEILGKDGLQYNNKAARLTEKVNLYFWNEEKGAYIDSFVTGNNNVTRHANIFSLLYNIATKEQCNAIIENVLKNNSIPKITTPYFEGYELDVMGKIGDIDYIYDMITSYWKGMLDLGATTVWEEYNPNLSGVEHYAMYGDKYQKSLCHAWGASPIYLIGKYFLGVSGTTAGYKTFTVNPKLGKFEFIEGTVPVRNGNVYIYMSKEKLTVKSTVSGGTLIVGDKEYPLPVNESLCITF